MCPTQNKHFKFDLDRKLNPFIKIRTKFLDMVTKRQNRKDHSVSAIFFHYSIFNNRSQINLFIYKAHDKLIIMTGEIGGVPVLVGEL